MSDEHEADEIDWDNVEYDGEGWPIRPASRRFSWLPERPGLVVRHCNMCEEPFAAAFEHDAVCPKCGWPNPWKLIAVPRVEDVLQRGERLGLVNAETGREIVRCPCGELFSYPRWEAGECPSCRKILPLVPPPPGRRSCELARGSPGRPCLNRYRPERKESPRPSFRWCRQRDHKQGSPRPPRTPIRN
jgi:hypothetical protein